MSSEELDIRARATHALGSIGDPNMAQHLFVALKDPNWPVRAMAAKALGRMRVAEAIQRLSHALRDPQWWVRQNAAHALCAIGSQGVEALENLINDGDAFAREQAILMLEEVGRVDQRANELSEGQAAREKARKFMERIVAAGKTGRLAVLSREHPKGEVRRELRSLLPKEAAS
jgi:HEAT repeat protein